MTDTERIAELTKALNEIKGFAERNVKRAEQAYVSAKVEFDASNHDKEDWYEMRILEGRFHEAVRVMMVIQERVKEALR